MRSYFYLLALLCLANTAHASDQDWKGQHIVDLWLSTDAAMVDFGRDYNAKTDTSTIIPTRLLFNPVATMPDHYKEAPQLYFEDTSAYRHEHIWAGCPYDVNISPAGIIESIALSIESTAAGCQPALPPAPQLKAAMQYHALTFARQQPRMFFVEKDKDELIVQTLQINYPPVKNTKEKVECSQSLGLPLDDPILMRQDCFTKTIFRPNGTTVELPTRCSEIFCNY